MNKIQLLFDQTALQYLRMCASYDLGIRMGILGCKQLDLELPLKRKQLFVFAESSGSFASGIFSFTKCCMEEGTMKILPFGKETAVFVDTETCQAILAHTNPEIPKRTCLAAPGTNSSSAETTEYFQHLSDEELFITNAVKLDKAIDFFNMKSNRRQKCKNCGEYIFHQMEVVQNTGVLCRSCAGVTYYKISNTDHHNSA